MNQSSIIQRKWAFLIVGPEALLECLPRISPWWNMERVHAEWEVWIPQSQHVSDIHEQIRLAEDVETKMNGLAVSHGEPGFFKVKKFVIYKDDGGRDVGVPLPFVIKRTDLGDISGPRPFEIAFAKIKSINESALGELLSYWGQPNAETYEGLYKIYEWIKGKDAEIIKLHLSSKKRSLLTQTCNHPSSGPTARHSSSDKCSPEIPMHIYEVRRIVLALSNAYIKCIQVV